MLSAEPVLIVCNDNANGKASWDWRYSDSGCLSRLNGKQTHQLPSSLSLPLSLSYSLVGEKDFVCNNNEASLRSSFFGFSQLAFQSRINLARFYDADHKASKTSWVWRTGHSTRHASIAHCMQQLQCQSSPPTPLYFSFSFSFQIPYENEIFIGRLCFRYISWIVINFIDNCHILMAWLCAWLSDCCNAPVVAAAVVATCVAYAHSEQFFFLCFNSCAPFLVSFFFVANCFQRKLLHAQSYEQTEREQKLQGSRQYIQYMYVYRSGWQAFARHWLCKRQTVCAACEKLNEAIRALHKDQEEPPNGMACNVGGCMVGREILASCIEELFRQFMCENAWRKQPSK